MDADENEFERTVTRYRAVVLAAALRETGDFTSAEDAAQEVFIILYREFERLRDHDRLARWLQRTARNVARGIRRKRRLAEQTDEPTARDCDPRERLIDTEAAAQALSILSALPEAERNLLVSSLLDDLSADELADTLRVKPATVRKRLERARKRVTEAGRSYDQLAALLGAARFPDNYAERCRLSAQTQQTANSASMSERDVSYGLYSPDALAAEQRARKISANALALDPYNATNHAIMAGSLVMIARMKYLREKQHRGERVENQEWVGKLAGPELNLARQHARTAMELDSGDPQVVLVHCIIMVETSPSLESVPHGPIRTIMRRAHEASPTHVALATGCVANDILSGESVDIEPVRRALIERRGQPLDRGTLAHFAQLLTLAIQHGCRKVAGDLAELLADFSVTPDAQADQRKCLARANEALATS